MENKIDIMIEDSSTKINELVKIVKVLYYDTRYNRNIENENIIRVYSWYDIYMKINEIKKLWVTQIFLGQYENYFH